MEKPKLLPCPFCGGKAKLFEMQSRFDYVPAVECQKCGANIFGRGFEAKLAVEKWNRRVPDRTQKLWDEFGPSPTVVEPKRKRKA